MNRIVHGSPPFVQRPRRRVPSLCRHCAACALPDTKAGEGGRKAGDIKAAGRIAGRASMLIRRSVTAGFAGALLFGLLNIWLGLMLAPGVIGRASTIFFAP